MSKYARERMRAGPKSLLSSLIPEQCSEHGSASATTIVSLLLCEVLCKDYPALE